MSRIGKKPIPIPEKTAVAFDNGVVTVKGEKGELAFKVHPEITLSVDDGAVSVGFDVEKRNSRALQGLTRSLVSNMVEGVSKGYQRRLEINGIGYRAEVKGQQIVLNIGYSNPVQFDLPDGVNAGVEKNILTLSGIDKELLGRTAASIRRLRPPEPYKGKGIKYVEERIQRKAGKAGTK